MYSFILGRSPADTNSLNYSPAPENYLRQQRPELRTISQWLANVFGEFSHELIVDKCLLKIGFPLQM